MVSMAVAIMVIQVRGLPRPARGDWPRFAAAGLTGYTFYQLGFVLGLDRTSVFASSLLIATSPLFTMVFLALIGEHYLTWYRQRHAERVREGLERRPADDDPGAPALGVLTGQAQRRVLRAVGPDELEQAFDVIKSHEPIRRQSLQGQSRDTRCEGGMQGCQRRHVELDRLAPGGSIS